MQEELYEKVYPPPRFIVRFLVLFSLFLFLSSCGGGGGGSDESKTPVTQLIKLKFNAKKIDKTRIRLSWTVLGDVSGIKGYSINRSDGKNLVLSGASPTPITDNELTPSTEYCYHISPVDESGNEIKASNEGRDACAATEAADSSRLTVNLSPRTDGSRIILSWTVSETPPELHGFRIYRGDKPDQPIAVLEKTITSYNDSDLTQGQTYCYRVTAIDASGNELGRSDELCAASSGDTTPPSALLNFEISAPASGTEINLTWDNATDNVGTTGYNIYRVRRDDFIFEKITTVSDTSYTDKNVFLYSKYCYYVRAVDAAGNESISSDTLCLSLTPRSETITVIN